MLPLIVSILGVSVSAGLFWIGFERYKREVPHKGLSYSVEDNGGEFGGETFTIHVWNSGNVPIEQEDYLSAMGFNLGDMAEVQEVSVEGQQPEDLVVDASAAPSGKIQIAPIYLNPRDSFTLRISLKDSRFVGAPRPYGRIRGVHQLFRAVGVQTGAARPHKRTSLWGPPRRSEWVALIQALGPAILGLIGTLATAVLTYLVAH